MLATNAVVYLAGPMRGYPLYNFPAFERGARALRDMGYGVFSPHEHDLTSGFDPTKTMEEQGFSVQEAMRADLLFILNRAEAIVLLPDWRASTGACCEVHVARTIGLPLYELHYDDLFKEYELRCVTERVRSFVTCYRYKTAEEAAANDQA